MRIIFNSYWPLILLFMESSPKGQYLSFQTHLPRPIWRRLDQCVVWELQYLGF